MPQEILKTLITKDPKAIILNIQRKRFLNRLGQFRRSNPRAALFFGGLSGLSFLYASFQYSGSSRAQAEVDFRRTQLSKPNYELSGSEAYNVPWSSRNLDEWKYRQVTITGRPIHAKANMIPATHVGMKGYQCVVPFVTSEKEDGSDQHGVLMNLGFIPQEYAHPSTRYKVESADWQTFNAYVSTLDEYQDHGVLTGGNIGGAGENKWNYADIEKMAQNTGFTNWKNARYAVLERVNPNTISDVRSSVYRDHDSSFQQDFPYVKTIAGALQAPQMPWDYLNESRLYATLGTIFGGVAGVLFAVV